MKRYLKRMWQVIMSLSTRSKKWRHLVTAMAMVVVFITTYALILPAITLEKEKGKPEQGVYLEDMERGSTASLGQPSSGTESSQDTEEQASIPTGKEEDDKENLALFGAEAEETGSGSGSKQSSSAGQGQKDRSQQDPGDE